MIVFWNGSNISTARQGPDVGLDFMDQPAPAPDMPPQPPAVGKRWTIQVICQWMMRIYHHHRVNIRNRISMMIPLSWTQVVILRRSLPEAALRCRYREANTMTLTWMCL